MIDPDNRSPLSRLRAHFQDPRLMDAIEDHDRVVVNWQRLQRSLRREERSAPERLHQIEQEVAALPISHRTNLAGVIAILQVGALQSESERRQATPIYLPIPGVRKDDFISCYGGLGCLLHGLYRVELDPAVEELPGALFVPHGLYTYDQAEFLDVLTLASHWRHYLIEYVVARYEHATDLFRQEPMGQWPELLFESSIPIGFVRRIASATETALDRLHVAIIEQFGSHSSHLPLLSLDREV